MTGEGDLCVLCGWEPPVLIVPVEPFDLEIFGAKPMPFGSIPVCLVCGDLIRQRYFDLLCRYCVARRLERYRGEGNTTITEEESMRFFRNFVGQISRHINGTLVPFKEDEGER